MCHIAVLGKVFIVDLPLQIFAKPTSVQVCNICSFLGLLLCRVKTHNPTAFALWAIQSVEYLHGTEQRSQSLQLLIFVLIPVTSA